MVGSAKSDKTIDTLLEAYKQGHSYQDWITALSDYRTKLDGYDAHVLEYQTERSPDNFYTSVMFERYTIFAVEDRIYQIILTVAEKDRGGKFEQGYEHFFNSLKIVP